MRQMQQSRQIRSDGHERQHRHGVAGSAEFGALSVSLPQRGDMPKIARQRRERRGPQHSRGEILQDRVQPVPLDIIRLEWRRAAGRDRKSTRLNSSHVEISYAVFCLKKKTKQKK